MPTSLAPAISPRPRPPSGKYTRGLSLTDPNALGPHVSLGGDLFGKETFASSYQSYNSIFYGAKIVTAAPLTEQLGMSWSYSTYNQNLTLPSGATASLPIQQTAAAGPMWVSSVGTGMTYSTLDNPKSPTGRHARANKQRVCRARGRGQVRPDHGRRTLLS
jgi:outer membrane protein insertion porin family